MKRIFTNLALVLCTAMAVQAQDSAPVRVLSLQECREMAVENNAAVRIAEGEYRQADEVRREAFTKYFPTVEAQGLYFHSNKDVLHYDFAGMFSLGLIRHGTIASVYALQPVFAGGRIVNGNKLASVGVEAGRLKQENAVDNTLLTVEQYYWQIVTLKSKKQTLESVIGMLDTLTNQVNVAVNAGVVLPNDLLKVQLKRNQMETLMVDLDNGIRLSRNLLAQYVGLDGQDVDIDFEGVPEELPMFPATLYMEPSTALPLTADYRLLDAQERAARLQMRLSVGDNLPVVGVGAGYFYDNLLNEKYSYGALFVSVKVPISDWWGGSHAIKKSRIQVANAELQKTDLSQMLELNMQNTWDDLTAAYRKMSISHQSIGQATENLRLNRNFYEAGTSTITDLLDAQTLYRQSLDEYAEAYGKFCECKARYLDATGRMSSVIE